ncbi:helix-turn-helix domain-containing protein [uncultured Lactobacillus sp.]|uniref:helix-turn-helix domain-containing protein n=1 Tax=uncultured Lactobacillus sp. TaxID=153152 RepID=UPI00261DF9D2|nr:hypothetical protein [uncultured Lactobacillus sp.]
MTIGEALKTTRLSLNLSRREFSGDVVDSSHLARVEKCQNEISTPILLDLLAQNGVKLDTFLKNLGEWNLHPINSLCQDQISAAFERCNLDGLKKLQEQFPNPDSIPSLVIELMIKKLEGDRKHYPKRSKKLIKKFFLNVDSWDNDCLWVLSNTLEVYDLKEADGMVNHVIHDFADFDKYDNRKIQLLADIAANYLQICQDNDASIAKMNPVFAYMDKIPNLPFVFNDKLKAAAIKQHQGVHQADEELLLDVMGQLEEKVK